MDLKGKNIVVCLSGGIAAYKSAEIVSSLKKSGADVFVVMTKNACEFITPLTLETLSKNRVIVDMFDRDFEYNVRHISLASAADLFIIAPATANVIAKIANGIADDFLSTTVMATKAPVLVAPAMNTNMLENEATKHNIDTLSKRGYSFIYGKDGLLACGDRGSGRMAEPSEIARRADEILFPRRDYKGKTVLVTAGATVSPIDAVRFITNRSGGLMGYQLALAASCRGAEIIFVRGRLSGTVEDGLKDHSEWKIIKTETTRDMHDAVMANLKSADIIIKAAAPSDYILPGFDAGKKQKSEHLELSLVKDVDIAAAVGKVKKNKKLIVFAAEADNLIENAKNKLVSKNADMVVANDITKEGAGFDVETNIASLVTRKDVEDLEKMTKRELSDRILDKIPEL